MSSPSFYDDFGDPNITFSNISQTEAASILDNISSPTPADTSNPASLIDLQPTGAPPDAISTISIAAPNSTPNTIYSSPDNPAPANPLTYNGAPVGGSGGGGQATPDDITQLIIYNDPRAALQALADLGL